MDLNKKHLLYLIVFFLFLSLNAFGQSNNITGRILDQSTKEPVEYANVTLFRQDSVFIEGTVSDTIGRFGFTNLISDDYVLLISYMGFETKKILLQNFLESVEIDVFLSERMLSLDEIVISASSTISKINQRIVFPTKLQLDHSANGMQLLNTMMLSGLNINPMTNTISSSDGGKVVLQINGVNTTSEEILTLQPRQIRRIEYSDYAGIRYGEASKIVNYIVTRDDKGGIIGMDLMNSLNILAGGDVFFAKFNKGKSEYALNYTTAFQKINSNNRTRTGSYRFRSEPITSCTCPVVAVDFLKSSCVIQCIFRLPFIKLSEKYISTRKNIQGVHQVHTNNTTLIISCNNIINNFRCFSISYSCIIRIFNPSDLAWLQG